MNTTYSNIISQLPRGSKNAITKTDLCNRLNMTPRELRLAIHSMRSMGLPVLSTCSSAGLYLPGSEHGIDECEVFIRNQRNRARACFRSIRGARKFIRSSNGQLDFADLEVVNGIE